MSSHLQKINYVLLISFLLNLAVAALKIFYGEISSTLSMLSDGYHSLLDASSNVIGFLVIALAHRNHHHDHKKYEAVGAMGISLLLFLACYQIGNAAWLRFQLKILPQVTLISFIIMLITMLINYFVSKWEAAKAVHLHSHLLSADSEHTKSDFYASLAVLFALVGVLFKISWIDIVASIIIIGFIAHSALKIISESLLSFKK